MAASLVLDCHGACSRGFSLPWLPSKPKLTTTTTTTTIVIADEAVIDTATVEIATNVTVDEAKDATIITTTTTDQESPSIAGPMETVHIPVPSATIPRMATRMKPLSQT